MIISLLQTAEQLVPNQWPTVSREGFIVGLVVFVIVTVIAYVVTHSRWSWLPGIIFGVIGAIAWTASTPTAQLVALLNVLVLAYLWFLFRT